MLNIVLYFGLVALPSQSEGYTPPTQKEIEIALTLATSATKSRIWESPVDYPEGMVKYSRGEHTQAIFTSGLTKVLNKVNVRALDRKWVTSGGLQNISGWRSEKYRYIPEEKEVATWLGTKRVANGSGTQEELGILRSYPDGTRFDDVLINSKTNEVFEHRVAEKINGKWKRGAVYENEKARPVGYTGLKQSCISCHREAGTGIYGQGLVPGGDTIISDPLDFSVWPTEGDNKNTQDVNNPWQWTEEEGGYWWRWKDKESISVHHQGNFNSASIETPFPVDAVTKLNRDVSAESIRVPSMMYSRPTHFIPMMQQQSFIPQMNFAPSMNFSSGGGVCST